MVPSDPKKKTPLRTAALPAEPAAVMASPAEVPAILQSAPSLGALLHSLRRSWKLVMPTALLCAVLASAVAWMFIPAQYTSTMTLRLLRYSTIGMDPNDDNFANVQKAQTNILKSFDVLNEAIVKSRITETYGVTETPTSLAKKLVVHFNDGPEMMSVQLSGENPEAVAALLNAIGEVLPKRMLDADTKRLQSAIEAKERQLKEKASLLNEKRKELISAETKVGLDKLPGMERSQAGAERRLDSLQSAISKLEQDLASLTAERTSKERRLKSNLKPLVPEKEIDDALVNNPEYQGLLVEMSKLRQDLDQLRRTAKRHIYEEESKPYLRRLANLQREADQIREQMRERLAERNQKVQQDLDRRSIEELTDKIEGLKQQKEKLDKEVDKWQKVVNGFKDGTLRVPLEVLALRDQVGFLEEEMKSIATSKAGLSGLFPITPRLSRHTDAFVPNEKDYSRPLKYSLAVGTLMFGVCLIGGCLLEARARKINDSSEIRDGLGLKILGTIPALPSAVRKKSAAALSMGGLDSQFGLTEAVDAVRTRLLHAPQVDGVRIIMITSATTGEGKTTLSSHLAASLARAWRKTLLIDGDLRNPNAHLQFDLPGEPGLSEALRGEIEFEDAIKPTSLSRLWLLPAGRIDLYALQALTQEGLSSVFDRLKEQFDFIVIDTSPVLPVPDALVLGQQADAVLLSVMRDVSRMPAVYQAQQNLEELGIRVLGTVVSGEKTETYGRAVPYGPLPGAGA
ncbi:MAG: polysaccharide biosynthesis tyrosine autokinase [Gemmataceae bacterium]